MTNTESIKALEIKTSKLFNLVFTSNTTLSCFFPSSLFIDLCFLISAVITKNFNPTEVLAIPTAISTKVAKEDIEIYPVIKETKISKWLI